VDLNRWMPILNAGRARFVSLQYTDDAVRDVSALRERYGMEVVHWPGAVTDYEETAALVTALDLILSVCTAVVHLGGALGRPVWVMAPYSPEWRYGFVGERMPWYPSVHIFRQESDRKWEPVINRVAREFAALVQGRGSSENSG
jgi:hypothetical protein